MGSKGRRPINHDRWAGCALVAQRRGHPGPRAFHCGGVYDYRGRAEILRSLMVPVL
jgi:hypothetical protein